MENQIITVQPEPHHNYDDDDDDDDDDDYDDNHNVYLITTESVEVMGVLMNVDYTTFQLKPKEP